jgi:hypothetical protein
LSSSASGRYAFTAYQSTVTRAATTPISKSPDGRQAGLRR